MNNVIRASELWFRSRDSNRCFKLRSNSMNHTRDLAPLTRDVKFEIPIEIERHCGRGQ